MPRHPKEIKKKDRIPKEKKFSPFDSPIRRLQWIVAFAQDQVEPTNPLAIQELHQELGLYLDGVLLNCEGGEHGQPHLVRLGDPQTPDEIPMRQEDNDKSFEDKLALIRSSLRRVLHQFFKPLKPPIGLVANITQQLRLEDLKLEDRLIAADIREGLRFRLLQDLAAVGSALQQCLAPDCFRLFVRHHRQQFCSASCRNRTNFQSWYQKKHQSKIPGRGDHQEGTDSGVPKLTQEKIKSVRKKKD